jgi:hypothetical protein
MEEEFLCLIERILDEHFQVDRKKLYNILQYNPQEYPDFHLDSKKRETLIKLFISKMNRIEKNGDGEQRLRKKFDKFSSIWENKSRNKQLNSHLN